MPYTLWHCGVLIGVTDFEGEGHPRHYAGAFRPTAYGCQLFPRLSGMLTAAADLKEEMQRCGLHEDTMDADAISRFMHTTPAGQRVVDIGRALSEVELRDPAGKTLEFASIAFMDLWELSTLSSRLGCESELPDPNALPSEASRFIVSATLSGRGVDIDGIAAPRSSRT